ncbi:MAG TPA: hypothetical protein VLB44_05050 [Kofleriaceae bacterium]|nr:hypothetical protein [Kofleriaceae bacterium]
MRSFVVVVVCAVSLASGRAVADVRMGASLHGTLRTYTSYGGDSYSGFGPGLSLDAVQSHRKFAQGIHVGWHTYDEDLNNAKAHTRFQVIQVHYYVERQFEGGSLGFGVGLDEALAKNYSTDGAYSYSDHDTLIGVNLQLALDVLTTADSGRFGVLTGVRDVSADRRPAAADRRRGRRRLARRHGLARCVLAASLARGLLDRGE